MLCSHPADYTPVCTTELGRLADLLPEFRKRGVKVAALSCNDLQTHKGWIEDIKATPFCQVPRGPRVSWVLGIRVNRGFPSRG